MTEFEKKIKRYHNKKMRYNKDPEALINRLRKKEAEKYDFVDEKLNMGYNVFDKSQNIPRKPNKRVHFLRRVIIALIIILIIILLTIWARGRFIYGINKMRLFS